MKELTREAVRGDGVTAGVNEQRASPQTHKWNFCRLCIWPEHRTDPALSPRKTGGTHVCRGSPVGTRRRQLKLPQAWNRRRLRIPPPLPTLQHRLNRGRGWNLPTGTELRLPAAGTETTVLRCSSRPAGGRGAARPGGRGAAVQCVRGPVVCSERYSPMVGGGGWGGG